MKDVLTVPVVFQNRLILQRQKPIRIWGTGPARSAIKAVLNGAEPYTKVNLFNGAGFPALPFCLTAGPDSRWRRDNEVLEENHGTAD